MKRNSNKRQFSINRTKYTLQLRNVLYNERLSDETNCFSATLEVKTGKETYSLDCHNSGAGEETTVEHYNRESSGCIYATLNEHLKTVPNQNFISYMKDICGIDIDSTDPSYYYTLETLVDELVEECITE